ncbi:MAG: nucleotidyltransferase domain-containing protein [Candidatus Woesearchaeota archaeon]
MLLNMQKLAIMEAFLRNYTKAVTGSQIAREKKLNQKTVSNYLKKLEAQGTLKSTTEGKNLLYSLNIEDNLTIVHLLSLLENLKTVKFLRQKPFIKEVLTKAKAHCQGIVAVFGSYAKGTEKEDSDLDLLIIGKCNRQAIRRMSETYRLDISIKAYPEIPKKPDTLLVEVIKDHILISGTQEFIEKVLQWKKSSGVLA